MGTRVGSLSKDSEVIQTSNRLEPFFGILVRVASFDLAGFHGLRSTTSPQSAETVYTAMAIPGPQQ